MAEFLGRVRDGRQCIHYEFVYRLVVITVFPVCIVETPVMATHPMCNRAFSGYSAANYALSEVKNPVRTIKYAATIAVLLVSAMYLLVNVAYFAVVSKNDILSSRRIIA